MKNLIIKYAPIFIGITALADTQFDLLIQLGLTETAIAWSKLLGLLTALFLPSVKQSFSETARELDTTDPTRTDFPKGTKL